MSEPRYVLALAHAVETISLTLSPDAAILLLRAATSASFGT